MDPTGTMGAILSSVSQESIFFFIITHRDEANCLLPQFDFELCARFQTQHCGVCLTDQKVAIALHLGDVGQLPTTHADRGIAAQLNALGTQKCLIEGSEVHPIRTILLLGDITALSCQFGLGDITKFFDLGEQVSSSKHEGRENLLSCRNVLI